VKSPADLGKAMAELLVKRRVKAAPLKPAGPNVLIIEQRSKSTKSTKKAALKKAAPKRAPRKAKRPAARKAAPRKNKPAKARRAK
jgi:hypothetical protein